MSVFKIAVIGGDGVGPEVVSEGTRILGAVAEFDGSFQLAFEEFPGGAPHYREKGSNAAGRRPQPTARV